jgi:hypothetical protein
LKNQEDSDRVDSKDTNEPIDAELLGNPPTQRRNERRPRDRYVQKRDRSNAPARFTDGANRFVSAFYHKTTRAFFNDRTFANTSCFCNSTNSATDNGSVECSARKATSLRFKCASPSSILNVSACWQHLIGSNKVMR